MSIQNTKPSFKVLENNNLTGLRTGHVLANTPARVADIATTTWGTQDALENGVIVELGLDGYMKNYVDAEPFVVFTEELLDGNNYGLDQFADNFNDGIAYPRAIALYTGDTFTTDNVDVNSVIAKECYAKAVNGILTLQTATLGANFRAVKSTVPAGTVGYQFTYLGRVATV